VTQGASRSPFDISVISSQPNVLASRAEGNLVNEPDDRNPTALLVSAIPDSKLVRKDDAFYLGVLREGELWQTHRIMSGAPSRGTMALESETAPGEGSSVQVSTS
jgi:hypothetical protein